MDMTLADFIEGRAFCQAEYSSTIGKGDRGEGERWGWNKNNSLLYIQSMQRPVRN